jgi:hypothetical protein
MYQRGNNEAMVHLDQPCGDESHRDVLTDSNTLLQLLQFLLVHGNKRRPLIRRGAQKGVRSPSGIDEDVGLNWRTRLISVALSTPFDSLRSLTVVRRNQLRMKRGWQFALLSSLSVLVGCRPVSMEL